MNRFHEGERAYIELGLPEASEALSLEFASADDCTRYLVEVSPAFAELLSDKSPTQRVEFRHRLTERLQPYVQADGRVRIADVTVCVVGQA